MGNQIACESTNDGHVYVTTVDDAIMDNCVGPDMWGGWCCEKNPCPICREPLSEPVILGCGHAFDKTCIKDWMLYAPRLVCPLCRYNLTISFDDFIDAVLRGLFDGTYTAFYITSASPFHVLKLERYSDRIPTALRATEYVGEDGVQQAVTDITKFRDQLVLDLETFHGIVFTVEGTGPFPSLPGFYSTIHTDHKRNYHPLYKHGVAPLTSYTFLY